MAWSIYLVFTNMAMLGLATLYIHLLFTVNEYGRNQTVTTEQHKQAKSKFSSNINHNEHQSRSMEQQIYHSHV